MDGFSVRAEHRGDTTILHIVGELDLATVATLRSAAVTELDRGECETLALDLRELAFLDSTGLGAWVDLRRRATGSGKRIVIRSVPPFVRRVLEISALGTLFAETAAD